MSEIIKMDGFSNLNFHQPFVAELKDCQKKVLIRGGFKKKKKLMEFSIKLAGWVLDAPVFH